jgi:predicted MFS family arabinose efflux permease
VSRRHLVYVPYLAGLATAIPLWGQKAPMIFFSTAAEVLALGAVAMGLQGGFFRVSPADEDDHRGGAAMATILLSVGVGLGFAFGALIRGEAGTPHVAMTAGALSMGIIAFAVEAFFGDPGEPGETGGVV